MNANKLGFERNVVLTEEWASREGGGGMFRAKEMV